MLGAGIALAVQARFRLWPTGERCVRWTIRENGEESELMPEITPPNLADAGLDVNTHFVRARNAILTLKYYKT